MKAVLAAEIGDQVVVTVTMTKEELAQAGTAPVFLAAAVCGACSGVLTEQSIADEPAVCVEEPAMCAAEPANCAAEPATAEDPTATEEPAAAEVPQAEGTPAPESPQAKSSPAEPALADYREIRITDRSGSKEDIIERALSQLIDRSVIPVSEEEVKDEAEYEMLAILQKLRYDVMFRGASPEETQPDPEVLREEITESLIRERQENYILQTIIDKEGFEVSPEELLEEAESMARRQETTLDMVKSFFGEDLSGLAGDVQKRKARELIYQLAVRDY